MSLWFGGTGAAVGLQELVLWVCAGHQCQGADAATQRLSFQLGAISGIGPCSPALWLPIPVPIPIVIPLGSWWAVQPLRMSPGCALCQECSNGAGTSAGSAERPHINHLTPPLGVDLGGSHTMGTWAGNSGT